MMPVAFKGFYSLKCASTSDIVIVIVTATVSEIENHHKH